MVNFSTRFISMGGVLPLLVTSLRNSATASKVESSEHGDRSLQSYFSNCGAEAVALKIQSEIMPSVSNNQTVDSYFQFKGAYPSGVDCITSELDRCTTYVIFDRESTEGDVSSTNGAGELDISSLISNFTLEEPCTQCNYAYPIAETSETGVCQEVSCDTADCLPNDDGDSSEVPEMINMCLRHSRYDSFSSSEIRYPTDEFNCRLQTSKIVQGVEYLSGVTNVRRTELIVQDRRNVDVVEALTGNEFDAPVASDGDNYLEACEFVVDGTPCNGCRFCGMEEAGFGFMELDCSNIRDGAETSCDDLNDVMFGINPSTGYSTKLLTFQEGFVGTDPPTQSPTVTPNPYSDGITADDKLIVSQAHDQCINFDGRTPQLTGNEITNCEEGRVSSDGFLTLECRRDSFDTKQVESLFESSCSREGGYAGKSSSISVRCSGSGLIEFYNFTYAGTSEVTPRYLRLTHYNYGMYDCYASKDCKSKYGFGYKRNKEECETDLGYEGWYARYLEEQYRVAGLDSVTCSYDPAIECYDALEAASNDGRLLGHIVGFSFTILSVVASFLLTF